MAYTKIITIHDRMDHCIDYICNQKKTIDGNMDYVSKDMAVEDMEYTTCCNCSMFHPYEDMESTKERFGKSDSKRKGYHLIQSFKPGEGTADMVHEIGVRWATELFGDRFEFVVSTHLDKDYLHNHVVVNSTSFVDGKQYTNSKNDFRKMIEVSNRLCREYGLSVIENPESKGYSKRVPGYLRTSIKNDIDRCKEISFTWTDFVRNMELEGYEFTKIDNIVCVRSPYYKDPIPLNSLGRKYNQDTIYDYIAYEAKDQRKIHYSTLDNLYKKRKQLSGFMKLYYRFLYETGILPNYKVKKYVSKEMRQECKKLNQISQEVDLMVRLKIDTLDDLNFYRENYQNELDKLLLQRKNLYTKAYKEDNLIEKEKLKIQAKELTPKIKELRNKFKLLNGIEERASRIVKEFDLKNTHKVKENKFVEEVK